MTENKKIPTIGIEIVDDINDFMYRILFALLLCSPVLLAQEFVPPQPPENAVSVPLALQDKIVIASKDSVLGDRIAKISATMEKIPQEHGQSWREFDITPYTKDRKLPIGSSRYDLPPEQVLTDWILRQTGTNTWHTPPFGILTADSEKLYAFHTKEQLLVVADIVDRFVCPQLWNEACALRIVSTSRPDWLSKVHPQLKPIKMATQGVQGWIVEKTTAQTLLQELARRNDFKELIPPQPHIAHGIQHNVVAKKQRYYLRDVQPNPSVLNGYAEDRVAADEGIGLSITPLALLDGQHMATAIKMDIVQIERMLTTMIEIATASNSRQRFQIESPQIASFKLDEIVMFPKSKVLLLDLGTIPLPNTAEGDSRNVFEDISRGINPARRGNVLVFVECTSGGAVPAVSSTPTPAATAPIRTARPLESPYWQGIR